MSILYKLSNRNKMKTLERHFMELKAIEHLIETDEKTCERIRRQHAQRKQLKEDAEIIKKQMKEETEADTARIIAETKAELDEKIRKDSERNEAYFKAASAKMVEDYHSHRDEWVKELVTRITSVEA